VTRNQVGAAIAVVLPDAWLQKYGSDQCDDGALQMDNRRTGEVLHAQLGQPAATPDPVTDNRINKDRKQYAENEING
jgi:hypothetical protein